MDRMIAADRGDPEGPKLTRRVIQCGLIVAGVTLAVATCASADDGGEKRGEIGIQLGVRWADRDIVPDDSNGLGFVYGLEGAWAFNERWALFADLNFSTHDSKNFCLETDSCNALTPESEHKVLTLGIERRFKPGPKGGRWVLGLATGALDVEWNGIQLHNGVLSVSFGRRTPVGPGFLRWCVRVETGMFPNTDNQLLGALDELRQTNAVFLVAWGPGVGRRH
jgi:hypothetical protein